MSLDGHSTEKEELENMTPTDEKLFGLLNKKDTLDYYKQVLSKSKRSPRKKSYMTIVNDNLGYIVKNDKKINEFYILTIFNNTNKLLGQFIIESGIKIKDSGAVMITFYDSEEHVDKSKSLGKIIVFAKGQRLEKGFEAHHIQHFLVNFSDDVIKVEKSKNIRTRPLIKNQSDAYMYNIAKIIGNDESRYSILINNLQLLYDQFNKHNGIIVNGIDLTSTPIKQFSVDDINIEKSLF
ncbi:hypothetical protein [Schinkia azotoformans]|uniref:hypothetical protein n=2 Tax=Schinkia azotoformans TaxID=1454 RepID=UPI002DBC8543|nr:hypothetical protein [Schinkia azotoformans]MEC1718739.1 hypothetical protein [Schinkia azotoformans]MEC1742766.1 hypothetical protein [Schinkia azotoformans]MEC1748112.1 hypothetical protein [Schinkia azotoformans]MEC1760553.1 hypothetical protein [Schinkia azotoformans]MEC1769288.1 hypothetical protein [Schinkia azotoformans]